MQGKQIPITFFGGPIHIRFYPSDWWVSA